MNAHITKASADYLRGVLTAFELSGMVFDEIDAIFALMPDAVRDVARQRAVDLLSAQLRGEKLIRIGSNVP